MNRIRSRSTSAISRGRPHDAIFQDNKPTPCQIARALAVAEARREAAGELDLEAIEHHVQELLGWVDRIADMATKARTIQTSGKIIEDCAKDLKDDLDRRLKEVLHVLHRGNE